MDRRDMLVSARNADFADQPAEIIIPERMGHSRFVGEPSVGQYWRILLKRKWTVISSIVIIVTVSTIVSLRMTPIYEASGRISIIPPNTFLGFKATSDANAQEAVDDQSVQTQVLTLQSDALALLVIKKLHLDEGGNAPTTPQPAQADERHEAVLIRSFREELKVATIPNSRMIEVRYGSPNPHLAVDAVNTLIKTYIEQNIKTRFDSTMEAADWLSKQLPDLQIKVESSQEKLVRYQKEHEILGTDEKQNTVTSKLDALNRELTAAEADRLQKESLYQLALSGNYESVSPFWQNPTVQKLHDDEVKLEADVVELSSQFGPSYPPLVDSENRLKQVQAALKKELQGNAKRIASDYFVAVHHEQILRGAFEQQKKEANLLNESAIEYSLLKRDADSNRQLYDGLLQKMKEASISAGMNSNNVRIVDPARIPLSPSRPNIPRNVELGFLLGVTGGLALAFALESLDNTVRTPDEVEMISGLPSLGMIPMLSTRMGHRSRTASLLTVGSNGSEAKSASLVSLTDPQSEMSEAYRALRTQILLSSPDAPPKVILVTSALPEEGKTTTALNTAIVLAQQGGRVLLVDADFRRPSVHKKLGLRRQVGLSNVLASGEDPASVIWHVPQLPNLWVLPCGSIPPHPAELVGSARMRQLLHSWRQEYDHIVIDSPPVLSVTDAVLLAVTVDSVILVLHSGRTTKAALRRTRDLLMNVNASVMGVVVNAVNLNSPDYYYYYYSGAKYGGYYAEHAEEKDEPEKHPTEATRGA